MLPPLRDDDRRTLAHLSVLLCIGSLALLPLTTGISWSAQAQPSEQTSAGDVPAVPERLRFPEIHVRRDPFVPDGSAHAESSPAPLVVGNAAGAAGPQIPLVHAVVLGPKPEALVEVDGSVRIFSIGDSLGGAAITAIDRSGVVLSDGRSLALEQPRV